VSGNERKPVSNKQAASLVGLSDATLSLGNPFLVDVGIIEKTDSGFIPSAAAIDFKRASELGEERPEARLGPLLRDTWFYEALRPRLEFQAVPEQTAITDIGVLIGADKDDLSRVRALLDYLAITGIVLREGGMLMLVRSEQPRMGSANGAGQGVDREREQTRAQKRERDVRDQPKDGGRIGAITFSINVDVGMEELMGWDAARIAAFMDGVSRVLRAQKGVSDAE
jgi:hypothetical protein